MKLLHRMAALLLSCVLLFSLAGCAPSADGTRNDQLRITTTTYPLYVLTSAITAEAENVVVQRLNTGSVSCLHDYTLTVSDMRHLEQADLLILNGAGLEDFLEQAFSQLSAVQVDCSESVSLLEGDSHEHHNDAHHEEESDHLHDHGHDHSHEHDAHYWMDPCNLIQVTKTIAAALSEADPAQKSLYQRNAETICADLQASYDCWAAELSRLSNPHLITFHDGFYYFAEAFGLEILFSMEEEDGATASAKDILTASMLVKEYNLPSIFAEVNGSGAAARAVSGETGVAICQLSMLMDGDDAPAGADASTILEQLYIVPMSENIKTLSEVLK